ncbi:MAG: hypothetical protein A2622_07625 [Bdellovibrionales bacterium RIFCSPHIGHO2_01_FULL_40_29]|nr:MAG: hypothetical protein A2622_07625 [Bdellovibrionales bacterium RIFCSPHIGHO2_01_FULL_40_29]OFZ34210.1 MAG: hypothetical protein A3D17_04025 [Bdellovibrionales bacterium RIFCSPHIGHO2_02_FULL_40_15]
MKKLLPLLILPLLVVACNPKKDPVRATVNTTNTLNNTIGSFSGTTTCPQGTTGIGTIYDNGQQAQMTLDSSSGTFESRVKALLSATISPDEIGQISSSPTDSTGVRFQGMVRVDGNGMVVAAQSKMLIKVYDSFVLNAQLDPNGTAYEPVAIEFLPTNGSTITGQFNLQTGDGYMSFKDSYGEVRFDGRLDAQTFSGVVRFQNTRNVNGGAAASGTLGQFYVARCGIIQ